MVITIEELDGKSTDLDAQNYEVHGGKSIVRTEGIDAVPLGQRVKPWDYEMHTKDEVPKLRKNARQLKVKKLETLEMVTFDTDYIREEYRLKGKTSRQNYGGEYFATKDYWSEARKPKVQERNARRKQLNQIKKSI